MDMMLESAQYCGKSGAMLLLNENCVARYKIPHVKKQKRDSNLPPFYQSGICFHQKIWNISVGQILKNFRAVLHSLERKENLINHSKLYSL